MLSQIINNAAVTTKLRAKTRGMLSAEDYDKMSSMSSVAEVTDYLKRETGYKTVLRGIDSASVHRGQLEDLLGAQTAADFASLRSFVTSSKRAYIELYFRKYEAEQLKVFIRLLFAGHPEYYRAPYKPKGRGDFDLSRIEGAKTFEEFVSRLRGTEYYTVFSAFAGSDNLSDTFDAEQAVDMHYFQLAFKYIKRFLPENEQKIILKTLGSEVDLVNIMFILRVKAYYEMTPDKIYTYIVPKHYRISRDTVRAMAESASYDEAYSYVLLTPYREVFERGNNSEKQASEYLNALHKKLFLANPYTTEAIMCFINRRKTEIRNIISIVEGVRYSLPPDKIREYIVGYDKTKTGYDKR